MGDMEKIKREDEDLEGRMRDIVSQMINEWGTN